ncbi:MAG: hypothetical protein ACI8RD_009018 [Bacillariaceae sp.]|jgi:hypothetical protein
MEDIAIGRSSRDRRCFNIGIHVLLLYLSNLLSAKKEARGG